MTGNRFFGNTERQRYREHEGDWDLYPIEPESSAWDHLVDRLENAREARMLAALAERARGCVTVEEADDE